MDWSELHKRFQKLRDETGANKTSSYAMDVSFDPATSGVSVHLGTYDIGDWPRHTYLGPFANEDQAKKEVEAKIIEAERVVAAEISPNPKPMTPSEQADDPRR